MLLMARSANRVATPHPNSYEMKMSNAWKSTTPITQLALYTTISKPQGLIHKDQRQRKLKTKKKEKADQEGKCSLQNDTDLDIPLISLISKQKRCVRKRPTKLVKDEEIEADAPAYGDVLGDVLGSKSVEYGGQLPKREMVHWKRYS
ncbi:hypothetical protein GIB67_030089 [Kingdonia uniflora]|uniref:Uncharacterized protein n=1 Tax=Kingdonia uniflora TaxID=39325 RepID=A0A7J7L2N1_9MAGN|nr:hypothetical protein GIB67_030089 [Kingdonia uniflora]